MPRASYQETANGRAYTYAGITVLFRFGDGLAPQWVSEQFGPMAIVNPERFGTWSTRNERMHYARAFASLITTWAR